MGKQWAKKVQKERGNRQMSGMLLGASSGALLGSAYIDLRLAIVPWFALLPLLVGLNHKSLRSAWVTGTAFGLTYMATASHWIVAVLAEIKGTSSWQELPIGVIIWVAFSQWFALMAVVYVWAVRCSHFPKIIVFPIVGTVFFEYGYFVFPTALGVTQSTLPVALQALDIFGHAGLVFIIMAFNSLLYRELYRYQSGIQTRWDFYSGGVFLACLAWFIYGYFRIQHWENGGHKHGSLSIGIIQGNESPSVVSTEPPIGFSYAEPPEILIYQTLSSLGAELVVWPESRVKGYFRYPHVKRHFQHTVNQHKAGLLIQDMNVIPKQGSYNTAVFLTSTEEPQHYQKVERILFGEYLPPFLGETDLGKGIKHYLGAFYQPILRGPSVKSFEYGDNAWLPLICYEAVSSIHVVNGINHTTKHPEWISVQSNNSWFGKTVQPHLHLAITQLRAVENRLPVVHAINNGPSAIIGQSGRYTSMTGEHVSGGFITSLQPARPGTTTFYNQHPYVLKHFLFLSLITILVFSCRSVLNSVSVQRRVSHLSTTSAKGRTSI